VNLLKKNLNLKSIFAALLLAGVMFSVAAPLRAQDDGRNSTPEAREPQKDKQEKNEDEAYKHSAAVKAFGKMLGMDVEKAATVFEIGNFVVLAGLVGFGLLKMLPKTFRDRTSAIQKHLVDARAATAEASARLNSVEERLSKLDGQIAEMKTQAEKDSAADELRIKASVEEDKKKILAAAEQEISAATVQAQRQLQQYAAELAIEQAARKLVVTAETDRLIVQNFARRLGADDSKGGQN
jgi:F-type H+-transporting ATPase subunit b